MHVLIGDRLAWLGGRAWEGQRQYETKNSAQYKPRATSVKKTTEVNRRGGLMTGDDSTLWCKNKIGSTGGFAVAGQPLPNSVAGIS